MVVHGAAIGAAGAELSCAAAWQKWAPYAARWRADLAAGIQGADVKPSVTEFQVAPNMAMFAKSGRRHIRKDLDVHYRKGLAEAVALDGDAAARFHIANALYNGPSAGGATATAAYFGAELDVKLKLTAMIVDGLEISLPGFKKWLEMTGFGNDKTMIRGFVAWAEHKEGWGRVITGVKEVADRGL